MKKMFWCAAFVLVVLSCNKNESDSNSELVGKYELSEILADPGDGSGVFRTIVNSGKIIEFKKNGTIKCNGELCNMNEEIVTKSKGTYSIADSSISVDNCLNDLKFKFVNDELIIIYPCFEACEVKYVKL